VSSPFNIPESEKKKARQAPPSRLQDAPELQNQTVLATPSENPATIPPQNQPHRPGGPPVQRPGRPNGGAPDQAMLPPPRPDTALGEHRYVLAGALTASQIIAAKEDLLGHLESKIMELVGRVQQELVDQGMSDEIVEARHNPELREKLAFDIDRLTLSYLMKDGRTRKEDKPLLIAAVINEILGLGPLQPLWQEPGITEVIVNGPADIYVEQQGKLVPVRGVKFRSSEHLLEVCQRVLAPLNRKLDVKDPLADGRLPDGSRVNVVHPAIAPRGPLLTIRRFPEANRSFADLVSIGSMSHDMACTIAWLVRSRASTLVVGATGTGKLLPLDTQIPTLSGWTTMGSLSVGDTVLGRNGLPCRVTFLSDIEETPDLYRIVFSDGQEVTADSDHQWVVASSESPVGKDLTEKVLTTSAMIRASKENPEDLLFVRLPEPVVFTEKEIPMSAYAFGLLLGGRDNADRAGSWDNEDLEALDVQDIPLCYLRGSIPQRLNLLRGFLLAKGTADPKSGVEFELSANKLGEDFVSLCRSLGLSVSVSFQEISGQDSSSEILSDCCPSWRVKIMPSPIFDAEHWDATAAWSEASPWLAIEKIEPVPTQPGRCIQVDSPDSTYLVKDFVPTHNTTLLNALSAAIPRQERVVTIEDSLELRLHPDSHVAAMEARPTDASGQNSVPIKSLVKNALRMRPDRIIVGEVRGAEALNMLEACNTGHEGSMSTVHANGPDEALSRLSVMIAQGGEMPPDKVDWLVSSALDLIVQVKRYKDGSRRVSGIYEVPNLHDLPPGSVLKTVPLWEWRRTGEDDNGRILGEYVKVNELSAHLRDKLGLDFEPPISWDDVLEISDIVVQQPDDTSDRE